jgi:hypothetical protein
MGKSLLVALLLAGFGGGEPPDGHLVLAEHGRGEWAAVADPRSGELHRHRLPGGTLCGPFLTVGDRLIFSGHRGRWAVARALPASLEGPARSLGHADSFAPSANPGRLWLARWPRPASKRWSNRALPVRLREVDVNGRVTARAYGRLPRFASLHAWTEAGFVATEGRWLTLRRPGRAGPLMRIRDGWFAAAGRSRFAWCGVRCGSIHVWSRGDELALRPPAGARPVEGVGAFSPDERLLATAITRRGHTRAAIVDLAMRRWTVVPGSTLGDYRALAWSPSGRWLYFANDDEQVRAWRPGSPRSIALPIHARATVMSIDAVP